MSEPLKVLDSVRLNFTGDNLFVLNLTLAFIMFGLALEIRTDDFKRVFTYPKSTIVGLLSQFVMLPATSFILVYLLHPTPSVALGMILVAACPGGNISNFITSTAKGNVALSVSLTAIGTFLAIFMTPFNFALYGNLYKEAASIIVPVEVSPVVMFRTVIVLLGIPLIAGMIFARRLPVITRKIINPVKKISLLIFTGYIIIALVSNLGYFLKYIHIIFLLVLMHNALALFTGWFSGRVMKLPFIDIKSVTIETGIQNSGLALVLIFNPELFNGLGGMAFIAAWWGIWHMISGMVLAFFWSKK